MSDTMNDPAGSMANEGRDADDRLGTQGRAAAQSACGSAGAAVDQIGDYVRQQPVSTALLALGLGYIIGRLRIF